MSSKKIYPFVKAMLLILFMILIYYLVRTNLSFNAKSWVAVNICFAIVILLISTSLIKALYRRGSMEGYTCIVMIIFIILLSACYIVYSYVVSSMHEVRKESQLSLSAKENMTQLAEAIILHANTHDGRLPPANSWCEIIRHHDERITMATFKNPKIEKGICHFAFNKNLSMVDINSVPNDVVMLFEANGDWNLNGDVELLEKARKERQWVIGVVFVDGAFGQFFLSSGTARMELPNRASRSLKWAPAANRLMKNIR